MRLFGDYIFYLGTEKNFQSPVGAKVNFGPCGMIKFKKILPKIIKQKTKIKTITLISIYHTSE